MTTPSLAPRGPKKQIGILTDVVEHPEVQAQAEDAGVSVSLFYHILIEMFLTRVQAAKGQGIARPVGVSDLEYYVLVNAEDSDLLTPEQRLHLLWSAENAISGANFRERSGGIFDHMAKGLAVLEGGELPFVQVADDHPQFVQQEVEAARNKLAAE